VEKLTGSNASLRGQLIVSRKSYWRKCQPPPISTKQLQRSAIFVENVHPARGKPQQGEILAFDKKRYSRVKCDPPYCSAPPELMMAVCCYLLQKYRSSGAANALICQY